MTLNVTQFLRIVSLAKSMQNEYKRKSRNAVSSPCVNYLHWIKAFLSDFSIKFYVCIFFSLPCDFVFRELQCVLLRQALITLKVKLIKNLNFLVSIRPKWQIKFTMFGDNFIFNECNGSHYCELVIHLSVQWNVKPGKASSESIRCSVESSSSFKMASFKVVRWINRISTYQGGLLFSP